MSNANVADDDFPCTSHEPYPQGGHYCVNCGLEEDYWDKVPDCPALLDRSGHDEEVD